MDSWGYPIYDWVPNQIYQLLTRMHIQVAGKRLKSLTNPYHGAGHVPNALVLEGMEPDSMLGAFEGTVEAEHGVGNPIISLAWWWFLGWF